MKYRFPFIIIIALLGLVTFDVFQEKYLLETFKLSSESVQVNQLIQSHLFRWGVWSVVAIPLWWFTTRLMKSWRDQTSHLWATWLTLLTFGSTVFVITLISLIGESKVLFEGTFWNLFVFYSFKKSVIFLLAYGLLVLLIYSGTQRRKIYDQVAIIRRLKKKHSGSVDPSDSSDQSTKYLEVRIGKKIRIIEVKDIIWIQADDYCAKIHSANNETFIVRKTLKSLEKELSALGFVRIHRTAILNLEFLNTIDTQNSTVRLINAHEIPISKTGLKSLRNKVNI